MSESSSMTREEAYKVFQEGKTPQDLIRLGVKRSTAYLWWKEWRQANGEEEETDDARKKSFLFERFKAGMNMVDVIMRQGRTESSTKRF